MWISYDLINIGEDHLTKVTWRKLLWFLFTQTDHDTTVAHSEHAIHFSNQCYRAMKSKYRALNLKICLRLECVYRVLDARGKFGEHEKCVRVARGATESNSGFLSTLQTSRVHPQLDIRTAKSMSKLFYNRATTRICAKKPFIVIECNCDCFGFSKFPINNCVLYSPGWTNLKTTIKAKILPLNVINDLLVTFFCSQWMSFGQNLLQLVFRQICETCDLRVFFGFYFCCLLDQEKEKENCTAA